MTAVVGCNTSQFASIWGDGRDGGGTGVVDRRSDSGNCTNSARCCQIITNERDTTMYPVVME